MTNFLYITYVIVIFCNAIIGALQYGKMDKPLRVFYLLVAAIFINEVVIYLAGRNTNNIAIISHIYSIFELAIISIYFLYTILAKPKWYLIVIAFLCSVIFELVDISVQKIENYNNYMIVVESLLICPMALYVLYNVSNREDIYELSDYPHFYIWRSLLIWWSVTFFYWEFLIFIKKSNQYPVIFIYYLVFNILVYISIGYTLLRLKKTPNIINPT